MWWFTHNCLAHPLLGIFGERGWTQAFHDWTAKKVAFTETSPISAQLEAAITALRKHGRVCRPCGGSGCIGRFDICDCSDCIDGYPVDIARCIPDLAPKIDLPFVAGRRT